MDPIATSASATSLRPLSFAQQWIRRASGLPHRLRNSPVGRRLAAGAVWSLVGALISRGLTLVAFMGVAHLLKIKGFGELGIIQNTTSVFSVFAGFGLGLTSNRYIAQLRQSDPIRTGRIIGLTGAAAMATAACVAVTLFVLAPWVMGGVLSAPHLVVEQRIASLIMFFTAVNGAQIGVLSGFESFGRIARTNLWSGLISFPLLLGGAYLGGVRGAVCGMVLTQAANCLLYRFAVVSVVRRENIKIDYRGCWQEKGLLWSFSLPAILTDLLMGPMLWICTAILVRQSNGFSQMGLFNAAFQWRAIILFLPGTMVRSSMAVLSNLLGQGDVVKFRKVFRYTTFLNLTLSAIAGAVVCAASPWIMRAYGKEFGGGALVLVLLALSAVPNAAAKVADQVMASAGHMWQSMALSGLLATINVSLAWFLAPRAGAAGLALAILFGYAVYGIVECLYARKLAGNAITKFRPAVIA